MAITGDALPVAGAAPGSDDQWMQWALTVFGGNRARAAAAARAAAQARSAGASSDELFAAARAAYDTVPEQPQAVRDAAVAGAAAVLVRPSGRRVLGLTLLAMLVSGTAVVIVKLGVGDLVPVVAGAALIMAAWYDLTLRSSVRVDAANVVVQGMLHRRQFRRVDVRQITVQPRPLQMGRANGPFRGQFLASFVADDFRHLFELRQGAWTRSDIDRIGAAIGVRVTDDSEESVT